MAIGSTASSGTSGSEPEGPGIDEPGQTALEPPSSEPGPPAPVATQHDAARRAFFVDFGRQALTAAGQVAGMADLMGRTPGGGIAGLLGLEPATRPARPGFARSAARPVTSAAPAAEHVFHSAYRLAGDELVLLDQRSLPETLDDVVARRGSDVA